jgi:hypothetical protein
MAFTIELSPEAERLLHEAAEAQGRSPGDLAGAWLEERLSQAAETRARLLPDGLPPRPQTELLELARQQGVQPVQDPSALLGDFWPGDESVEEFMEARRAWQWEGRPTVSSDAEAGVDVKP